MIALENKQGETVLSSYSYELNDAGHRLSVTEYDGRTVSYTYDELYRLTEENINGGDRTIVYTYDNVGNRLSRTDSVEGTTTYTYDANDRLRSETLTQDGSTVQTVGYSYDANGNLTSRVQDTNGTTETTSYTWNDDNRLVRAELPNGDVATYEYDSEGIRVSSTVNGETTEYLIDKNRPYAQVLEEFRSDQLQTFYVYGHDLISQERGTATTFYQVDGLGSTRVLTDEDGNVTDTYDYEAFGELIDSSGDTENSYRFAGEQFDEELGDYYLRQRYYTSEAGRFISRDFYEGKVVDPLSLHKYIYASDNPSNNIDPSGLISLEQGRNVHDAIGEDYVSRANGNQRFYDQNFRGGQRLTVKRILREADGLPNGFPGFNRKRVDLADYSDRTFFEIKPANIAGFAGGLAQNILYYQILNYAPGQQNHWNIGDITNYYPTPVLSLQSGEIAIVFPPISGVILYKLFNPRIALTLLSAGIAVQLTQLIAEIIAKLATASRSPAAAFLT